MPRQVPDTLCIGIGIKKEVTLMHMSKLLTESEVAEILGIAVKTLRNWRCTRKQFLPYVKYGHSVRYRPSDLEAFVDQHLIK